MSIFRQELFKLFLQIQHFVNADLFDKFRNMADQNHRAVVFVERFGDNRQMAEVDVVGRLVQNQKPRSLQHQSGESD